MMVHPLLLISLALQLMTMTKVLNSNYGNSLCLCLHNLSDTNQVNLSGKQCSWDFLCLTATSNMNESHTQNTQVNNYIPEITMALAPCLAKYVP